MPLLLLALLAGGGIWYYEKHKTGSPTATLTSVKSAGPITATAYPITFTFSDGSTMSATLPSSPAELAMEQANPGSSIGMINALIAQPGTALPTRATIQAKLAQSGIAVTGIVGQVVTGLVNGIVGAAGGRGGGGRGGGGGRHAAIPGGGGGGPRQLPTGRPIGSPQVPYPLHPAAAPAHHHPHHPGFGPGWYGPWGGGWWAPDYGYVIQQNDQCVQDANGNWFCNINGNWVQVQQQPTSIPPYPQITPNPYTGSQHHYQVHAAVPGRDGYIPLSSYHPGAGTGSAIDPWSDWYFHPGAQGAGVYGWG